MGLDRGGSCKGLAYRVHHAHAADTIAYLRERHRENRDVRAIISAGDAVPHGRVVHAIDLVRRAGVTKFAIQGGAS